LASLELRNNISKMLGKDVPATLAFDYPTIQALAAFLKEQKAEARGPPTAVAAVPPQAKLATRHALQSMLKHVLGAEVPHDQPLMEACSLPSSSA
jgi:hypothetical protein